ncbi:MAG TPA: CoA protein activase [Bacillota bacterium]|jgi:predicted nucleotide-binding protein (sugar kinase/HSP70/actin superfamily)|nr:CoA protein activase [Peptococcaceae bacterium MAG4]NLW38417.1 CoA protein activase [Peptococcaceae bacterium]HPZ42483.1 CoA protein activase [Bacillota bacterium]HQD75275.1 CoA protein activase [Bacillota bacterium]HUM57710.1 CoA protein activase [Bacillota bacterium]
MRLTFPHMGNMYIPLTAILQPLGVEVVVPPPSSKRTLTLGSKYGPEFACLPLKLNLGNFIEAYELGANTVVMAGGCGPCRFGYYAQIEQAILKDLGYELQFIVLEPPERHINELLRKIRDIAGRSSWWQIVQAIRFGYQKALAVDEIERSALFSRPREKVPGSTDDALKKALEMIHSAATPRELTAARERALALMGEVAVDMDRPVLKVGLVGEIYTILEPFANLYLERHLGRLGVEVERSIYLSGWVNEHLFRGLARGIGSGKKARAASYPYLRHFVGGHGQETIGGAVLYARRGYDGIIQVFPFTCMPEIVAESILPDISKDYGIHSLTLIMDENTGEAGMVTRLEAFTDLLARKKETKEAL